MSKKFKHLGGQMSRLQQINAEIKTIRRSNEPVSERLNKIKVLQAEQEKLSRELKP